MIYAKYFKRPEYGIQLSFNNREQILHLPVMPASIEMSEGGKSSTYDVAGLGEINVIKDRKLSEYGFGSIFPNQRYPFVRTRRLYPPAYYVETIMRWMESGRPIRFIYKGRSFGINTAASIEDFQWKEVAGGIGDIEYAIKLKHYRFYAAKRYPAGQAVKKEAVKRPDDRPKPKTYTLKAGDSLWKVAQNVLGSGERWREIQKLNGISDAEVKRLPIGKVLKLP